MEHGPTTRCPVCGEPSSGTARFCRRCGARLPGPPDPAKRPPRPTPPGEQHVQRGDAG
ncbi:MAG: zinc-ribbon domain-containing protein [Solirubrobacteraceae bacterium]